jgi:hypothetical protein
MRPSEGELPVPPPPAAPASVERQPLNAEDHPAASHARERLRTMQMWAVVLGVALGLGGWYMGSKGHTGDAVAGAVASAIMWACAIGFGRARRRNASQATKDVITGVIRRRIRIETRYNVLHALDVGGVEVFVPAPVFENFREGQMVRVERLSGSRTFLLIQPSGSKSPDQDEAAEVTANSKRRAE